MGGGRVDKSRGSGVLSMLAAAQQWFIPLPFSPVSVVKK